MRVLTAGLVGLVAVAACGAAPARDGDPLLIGTVWTGSLVQRGGGPRAFDCALEVTARDGDTFEAELRAKTGAQEVTYLVRGTIKPVAGRDRTKWHAVEFTSFGAKDVKNTGAVLGVPYTASLTGKKLAGIWKSDEHKIEGDFEFEIGKK